jgi:hypothetical protein
MEIEEKLELNRKIRKYEGTNTFIKSLKTRLNSKWCDKISVGNRTHKILSDKQYEVSKDILN